MVRDDLTATREVARTMSVDATINRAHQHAKNTTRPGLTSVPSGPPWLSPTQAVDRSLRGYEHDPGRRCGDDRERRSVLFPDFLTAGLASLRGGKSLNDHIFTGSTGEPIRVSTFRARAFAPAVERYRKLDPLFPDDRDAVAGALSEARSRTILGKQPG